MNGSSHRCTSAQAQGLQLLGFVFFLMHAVLGLACSTAAAQGWQPSRDFVCTAGPWGGQLVPECVPHQPSCLLTPPSEAHLPSVIYLDELPLPPLQAAGLTSEADAELNLLIDSQLPPGARDGVFQKLLFTGTWLPRLEDDSMGWGDFETAIVLGFPLLRRETPLLVKPRFAVHLLDGPNTPDLPARLYESSIEFRHLRKFGNGPWAMDAAVTLGYYSDFEHSSSDAFRVTGYGVGVYESSPGTKWVFGATYLNRAGASVLPVGGVIIERSPNVKWELVVPRPRIAWRFAGDGSTCDERWFYVAGEYGGGISSLTRPISQAHDVVTYRDYRVLVGYERKIVGGLSRRFEVGYVFGRELEFESATPDTPLADTLFARAGLTY